MPSISHDWYILVVLSFLSILGVTITDATETASHWYWSVMVPIFFSASVYLEHKTMPDEAMKAILCRQAQHWLSLWVAVLLTLKLRDIGSLNNQTTGLILLLIFALTSFQAGITTGWLFKLQGVLLAVGVVLVAFTEHFIGLLIITGIVIMVSYGVLKDHFGTTKQHLR